MYSGKSDDVTALRFESHSDALRMALGAHGEGNVAASHQEANLSTIPFAGRGISTAWLRALGGSDSCTEVVLVLLPHAGGNAYYFVSWVPFLPDRAAVFAVEYPGHGSRSRERPETDADAICESLLAQLAHVALPIVFGGHSLGGLFAYELAVRHQARGGVVGGVLLSAVQPPHSLRPFIDHSTLADAELARHMDVPSALMEDVEALGWFVSLARADLDLSESLATHWTPSGLEAPALVIGGTQDDRVSISELMQWADLLRGRMTFRFFEGAHFFHQGHMPELALLIEELVPGRREDQW